MLVSCNEYIYVDTFLPILNIYIQKGNNYTIYLVEIKLMNSIVSYTRVYSCMYIYIIRHYITLNYYNTLFLFPNFNILCHNTTHSIINDHRNEYVQQ